MKNVFTATALALGLGIGASANAQIVDEVTFDCSGNLNAIVETADGVRTTGTVNLTVDLSNGGEWRSTGVIVIELPESAAGRDIRNGRINRCIGEGLLEATLTGNVKGVDIYRLSVKPSSIRVRVGNRRLNDPTTVEFASSAGGSPNV